MNMNVVVVVVVVYHDGRVSRDCRPRESRAVSGPVGQMRNGQSSAIEQKLGGVDGAKTMGRGGGGSGGGGRQR